MVKITLII